jgi:2-hydroxychromene-2-carboxylate isomerase
MPKAVQFYFDFISPYGWIAAEQIEAIAARYDRNVEWHPILLSVTVVHAMGLPPPLETPLKGNYLRHDIARCLRFQGLELAKNARFGFVSLSAARATCWIREVAPARTGELVCALYRTHWAKGLDISEPAVVLNVIEGLGFNRERAAAALLDGHIKDALREETEQAIGLGIFGSPSTVVDGEIFWGADRLSMVSDWLARGGW